MTEKIRIGTRLSELARVQSDHVAEVIKQRTGVSCEIIAIETRGDRVLDVPLPEIGGKGLFTQELEDMLLDGRVDIAVHSLKDLPADLPEGLCLGAITKREDPRDAVLSTTGQELEALPPGSRLGSGSVRRAAQIATMRTDLEILDLRGNVPTRVGKLDSGNYDAIVLATAGLRRLGMADRITHTLDVTRMIPAAGQGALGIECRDGDARVLAILNRSVDDTDASLACSAERIVQARLAGGCSAPVGVHVDVSNGCRALGFVGTPDGTRYLREMIDGDRSDALDIAERLADLLLAKGANDILESVRADER